MGRCNKDIAEVSMWQFYQCIDFSLFFFSPSEIAQMVNTSLERGDHGRLFAVVSIAGLQRKVTVEDVLVIETEFPPTVGDRLRLEKVCIK
jgi:hypothetical protein